MRSAAAVLEIIGASTGEPGAVNAACPVREGAVGKGPGNGYLVGGLPHVIAYGIRGAVSSARNGEALIDRETFDRVEHLLAAAGEREVNRLRFQGTDRDSPTSKYSATTMPPRASIKDLARVTCQARDEAGSCWS